MAAALIADKKVNTLILVHTKALLEQWRERLTEYLLTDFKPEKEIARRGRRRIFHQFGVLSSTENSLNGKIDIALIQSCLSDNEAKDFVREYGMVIVDECHHVSAVNFERVLREVNAANVYGLTATPIRKDGRQPVIFMQCGMIRYASDSKMQRSTQNFKRLLIPRFTSHFNPAPIDNCFAEVIDNLLEDRARNELILKDIKQNIEEGRTPLVLTARTAHVDLLTEACRKICPNVLRLVGSDSAKNKREILVLLNAVPTTEPLIVVANGKYVGEGFDLPRLDTLMLALPVSWKGLIAQYTGRLHRNYPGKMETRIYDYVDLRIPVCNSMYRKRLHGYKAVGYTIESVEESLFAEPAGESIFSSDNFEHTFRTDLSNARRNIIISTTHLSRKPYVVERLASLALRGIGITIICSDTVYSEAELRGLGINVMIRNNNIMHCAVIDRQLGWYGSVNLLGRSMSGATSMRMKSTAFASALLSALELL